MTRQDAISKGRKLIQLYRRGVGGERTNAGRLLQSHLKANDLTLYDLDSSLPVSQDLSILENWRESATLLAQLGGTNHDELLTRLVDATDLTDAELLRLLDQVDLNILTDLRADGWAYRSAHGSNEQLAAEYRHAARQVTPEQLLGFHGSIAHRLENAVLRTHFFQTHPQRLLRAQDDIEQHFLAGLVKALTGVRGELVEGGVHARLNAEQLAQLRTLQAQHRSNARNAATLAAEEFGAHLA